MCGVSASGLSYAGVSSVWPGWWLVVADEGMVVVGVDVVHLLACDC